jgi:hypothetical protein
MRRIGQILVGRLNSPFDHSLLFRRQVIGPSVRMPPQCQTKVRQQAELSWRVEMKGKRGTTQSL